ncbi:MAG: hypothetical protein HN348_17290 [Proteobacteria bacterium]|nr:hypothetical protein [Pseudomonadota bacterium]
MQLSDSRRSRFGFHIHIDDATDVPEPVTLRLAQANLIEPHATIRVVGNTPPPIRSGGPGVNRESRGGPLPPSPVLAPGTRTVVPKEARVATPVAPQPTVDAQRLDDVFTIEPVSRVQHPQPAKRRSWSPAALLVAFLFLAAVPPIIAVVAASHDAGLSMGTIIESIWTGPQR